VGDAESYEVIRKEVGTCIYETEGPIARLIMNRPEKANAQNSELAWDFDKILHMADADYDIKVLIIKANGSGFSAGHDLSKGDDSYPEYLESIERTGTRWKGQLDLFVWPVLYLWEFPKPTISQVHGYAVGGGSYTALLPDVVIASDDAYFQMPLTFQGLPGGQTMIEPWIFMNYHRAARYLMTSQTLPASEAAEMGLVNEVVPRDRLESTVEAIANDMAKVPLHTLMLAKAGIKRAWEQMGMRLAIQSSVDLCTLGQVGQENLQAGPPSGPGRREYPRERVNRVTGRSD